MKLIFALGNPVAQYDHTRHNVGFAMLDVYAKEQGSVWQHKDKFKAAIAELTGAGEKVLLAKPATYYNQVGESARLIADFYKIDAADILIIHDDLMLPFGTLRTRIGGRDAGNNGIKSLNTHIEGVTKRLRIGIWTEHRNCIDDTDFVLGKFTADEQKALADIYPKAINCIEQFIAGNFQVTTHV